MNRYTLIDPPVTPFSPREDIERWIETCKIKVAELPSDQQWEVALFDAESMLQEADA